MFSFVYCKRRWTGFFFTFLLYIKKGFCKNSKLYTFVCLNFIKTDSDCNAKQNKIYSVKKNYHFIKEKSLSAKFQNICARFYYSELHFFFSLFLEELLCVDLWLVKVLHIKIHKVISLSKSFKIFFTVNQSPTTHCKQQLVLHKQVFIYVK